MADQFLTPGEIRSSVPAGDSVALIVIGEEGDPVILTDYLPRLFSLAASRALKETEAQPVDDENMVDFAILRATEGVSFCLNGSTISHEEALGALVPVIVEALECAVN